MSWRFITCAALFVTYLVTANTIATKLIAVVGMAPTARIVIFPPSCVRTVPGGVPTSIIDAQWPAKVVYEAAATPLTYAAVGSLKSSEQVDAYDYATDFNPIRL